MPKTLWEYAEWLSQRDDLIWPAAPPRRPVKAVPSIKPLPGIRAVTWNVYGTLLRITDGDLLQLPQQQRAAYLTIACAADSSLRERVEKLLKVHEDAGSFLAEARERPAEPSPAQPPKQTIAVGSLAGEKEGELIDRYKILQEIGQGGGGVVYMAQQEEPVKRPLP